MNQLEQILSQYNRPARVLELVEAPQCYRVRLQPLPRTLASGKPGQMTRISHLTSLSDDIAAALGVSNVIVRQNGGIWLEIPKARTDLVLARSLTMPLGMDCPVLLGKDTDGQTLALDLGNSDTAHLLISGSTGSGKSVLLETIVYSLTKRWGFANVIIIDPHAQFGPWANALGVYEVTGDPNHALTLLRAARAMVAARLNSPGPHPRFIFVIDEFASLLQGGYGKEIEEAIVWILANARKVGVHVIAATQYPGHEICKGLMKANFTSRIAMRLMSWQDSMVALGMKGAERLNGRGDGLLRIGMELTRFQGAVVEDVDMLGVAQKPVAQKKAPPLGKVGKKGSRSLWDKLFKGGRK